MVVTIMVFDHSLIFNLNYLVFDIMLGWFSKPASQLNKTHSIYVMSTFFFILSYAE